MDNRTVITGVRIPFWDLVNLLVQLAIAAIPAMLLVSVVFAVLWALVAGMLTAL